MIFFFFLLLGTAEDYSAVKTIDWKFLKKTKKKSYNTESPSTVKALRDHNNPKTGDCIFQQLWMIVALL